MSNLNWNEREKQSYHFVGYHLNREKEYIHNSLETKEKKDRKLKSKKEIGVAQRL